MMTDDAVATPKRRPFWENSTLIGILTVALGLLALVSPYVAGEWTLAILGLVVLASALAELARSLFAGDRRTTEGRYLHAIVLLLVGLLLFLRPALVLEGLLALLGILVALDGIGRIVSVFLRRATERPWNFLNGAVNLVLGLLVLRYRHTLGPGAIGLFVGLWLISSGWAMLFARRNDALGEPAEFEPGARLGLPPSPELERVGREVLAGEETRRWIDLLWCLTLAAIFFAIHIGRMELRWDLFGILSTAVAVVGDLLLALLLAVLFVFPARLIWRRLTRRVERDAWRRRLGRGEGVMRLIGDRLIDRWLVGRVRFDAQIYQIRASLATAVWRAIQVGLPPAVILVAINPIWGFTWYFNTENWVSGFWQKLVEARVDPWRARMIEAVLAAEGATLDAPELFEVRPEGVAGAADFSFLVIGDPGEGDPSQHALRDRYLIEGRREDVRFLVVASDVVYPAGAMKNYELNFYLPFKGIEKPIYAIPGNHDWFGALDAFNANFLEAGAARAAMRARVDADLPLTYFAVTHVDELVAEAGRLRAEYGVRTGFQRAPFFEVHGRDFALIAADTGIARRFDASELVWFAGALERARGKFTMVLLGHPFYAGGVYQGAADPTFGEIHALLRSHAVQLVVAGDTHDFEYYREAYEAGGATKAMHHMVNGGGGAYLSIGTSLGWPAEPATPDWAYYPATAAVVAKLDAETPAWKRPFWWWLKGARAWPSSPESLSGVFDFNRAPFFQSFLEIRVEGSQRRVRLILHGVRGPLRWRDLQVGGRVIPDGLGPDDPVEFVIPHESL